MEYQRRRFVPGIVSSVSVIELCAPKTPRRRINQGASGVG